MGRTRIDRIRNDVTRDRVGTESISNYRQRQSKMVYSVEEKALYFSTIRAYERKSEEYGDRGRPRTRRRDKNHIQLYINIQ